MRENMRSAWWIVALAIIVPVIAMSQGKIQSLAVSGHEGTIPVMQVNGRNYVEVEALTHLVSGSLSFNGNQITLTLSPIAGKKPPINAARAEFSTEFLRAGIEEASTIREWHSALATAIENQFPVTPEVLGPYEIAALKNLRIAQAAAATDADQHASQMITSAYQKMKQLNDYYLAQRASATYIQADALANDPRNQSLIACDKSLAAMAASGQFTDDTACR